MIEALALDFKISDLLAIFDTDSDFQEVGWYQGLFCADLPTMDRFGEMFARGESQQALQVALTGEQCANLRGMYDADIRFYGKVYGYQGDFIQVVGIVPEGQKGPMSYVFIKLSTLAS